MKVYIVVGNENCGESYIDRVFNTEGKAINYLNGFCKQRKTNNCYYPIEDNKKVYYTFYDIEEYEVE